MERELFFNSLKLCAGGLAERSPVTAFTQFWFDGQTVSAYNDIIGVDADCKTDVSGGLPGALLLGLVGSSLAKQVTFSDKKSDIQIKLGAANATLPKSPTSDRIWTWPSSTPKNINLDFVLSTEFLTMLKMVATSAAGGASETADQGVCVIGTKSELRLFAYNGPCLSWATVPFTGGEALRAIWPLTLCKLLEKLGPESHVHMTDDGVYVTVKEKTVRAFSRLLVETTPRDYVSTIKQRVAGEHRADAVPVPQRRLQLALDRMVLFSGHVEDSSVRLKSDGKYLSLSLVGTGGSLYDRVALEKDLPPGLEGHFDAKLLRDSLDCGDVFLFDERRFFVTNPNGTSGRMIAGKA